MKTEAQHYGYYLRPHPQPRRFLGIIFLVCLFTTCSSFLIVLIFWSNSLFKSSKLTDFLGAGAGFLGEGTGFLGEGTGFLGADFTGSDAGLETDLTPVKFIILKFVVTVFGIEVTPLRVRPLFDVNRIIDK